MTTEELKALAECVTAAWEDIEGESMRDGHKQTMENLIFKTLQQVHREVQRRTREEDRRYVADALWECPECGGIGMHGHSVSPGFTIEAEEDSER